MYSWQPMNPGGIEPEKHLSTALQMRRTFLGTYHSIVHTHRGMGSPNEFLVSGFQFHSTAFLVPTEILLKRVAERLQKILTLRKQQPTHQYSTTPKTFSRRTLKNSTKLKQDLCHNCLKMPRTGRKGITHQNTKGKETVSEVVK